MAVLQMNAELYRKTIRESDKPVLVEFWAPWCSYCRRLAPALAQMAREYEDTLLIGQLNIDDETQLALAEKIELVPTLLLYRNSELLGSIVAPESKAQLENFLDENMSGWREKNDVSEHVHDMIVIGGGPAGYTAALYAARAGLDTVVLEKLSAGGQMALTDKIENYPGFEESVDGFELGEKMRRGAEKFGVRTQITEVTSVSLSGEIKKVVTSEGALYGKTIVLATGASPKELGVEGE
ncbi:MAG: thioredoxin domain-containing protein, partial [Eubacteriales bacterium]|nr:thioredoxin domain-containing protein [Eubacteriales bacterium]